MSLADLAPPSPLDSKHTLAGFDCGEASLDNWLQKRAAKNEGSGASRTYVVCEAGTVLGYYCLAAGALGHDEAPKAMRRNMPDPIPVLILGRLAVDQRYQNRGLGKLLLRDAIRRALQASQITGVVALLVQAISQLARRFYLTWGFIESPVRPMLLILILSTAEKALITANLD